MNIIIMNNRASFLVSFWSVLISRLQEEGHQVTCLVPAGDSEAEATLKGFGASIRNYPLDNNCLLYTSKPYTSEASLLRCLLLQVYDFPQSILRAILHIQKSESYFSRHSCPALYGMGTHCS